MESILLFLIEHFPDLLDVNLTASIVILFVMCVRQFLKGAPKIFSYALWGIVLLRLLVPISIESSVSFVPERTEFSGMVDVNEVLPEVSFETAQDRAENRRVQENTPSEVPQVETAKVVDPQTYLTFAWLAGIAVMLLCSFVSYLKLRQKVKVAIPFRKGIRIADDIPTPFVMGFFRPVIYLPGTLDPWERTYIIAHERHHIHRGDHIFKALGFLALTIHWFNPFVWAAFVLASRDMEMSCDEAVIRKLGEDVRAEYSASLLNLATSQRLFSGTPLAFGEADPAGRVRNLAKWKKPAIWVISICAVVCIALAVCLLTDPEASFPMEFEQYFVSGNKAELLSGNTSERNSRLHITFKETSGPQTLTLELWYRQHSEEQWVKEDEAVLSLQDDYTFAIPSDCAFAVAATAQDGKNGYATVALSAGQGILFDEFAQEPLAFPGTKSSRVEASAWTVPEETAEEPDGAWGVTLQAASVTQRGAQLRFTLDDSETEGTLYFGESYHLYLWDNDRWAELAAADEQPTQPAAVERLTQITPGTPVTQTIDWQETHGNLPAGKYRIQLTLTRQKEGEYPASKPIYAEFSLAGYQNWAVSIQAHDVTPESLILTYHNASDEPFYRLPGYTLQRWENSQWIELDVGKTWHETTEQVDFEHQSQTGNAMFIQWDGIGSLPQGQYLIGQEFCTDADLTKGQRFTVYASFEVGEDSGAVKALEDLPEVYSAEQAMIDGCFVQVDGIARHNQELFHQFAADSWNGAPAFLRIVNWHYGEDSRWSAVDLTYDGSVYTITGESGSYTYRYLKHYTGEKAWENADHDAFECYALVNDASVTWEDLSGGALNGQEDGLAHWTVYMEFTYLPKKPQLPENLTQAVLEFEGVALVTVTDFDRLEKLFLLFENAELIGYEPKTHSTDVGLHLVLTAQSGETMTIELDPDNDLCRINGEYIFYGAYDEDCYITKLWEYLGLTEWPEVVYASCVSAFRP